MTGIRVLSVLRTSAGLDDYPLWRALVTAGCDVVNLDDRQHGFHEAPNAWARAERRLNRDAYIGHFNAELMRYVEAHRPQLMLLFKASHVRAEPVRRARALGCRTVCLYPDLDPQVEGPGYVAMLREVDDFLHTKPHLAPRFRSTVRADAQAMLPMYSRLEVAAPAEVDPDVGVLFVGHHSPGKERALRAFVARHPGRVTVVGDGWPVVPGCVQRSALYGGVVRRLYRHAVCALGLLMEGRAPGDAGDEVTSRSVLVPASGGLLLHPRNPSAVDLYGGSCELLYDDLDAAARLAAELAGDPARRLRLADEQRRRVLQTAPCAEDLVAQWIG